MKYPKKSIFISNSGRISGIVKVTDKNTMPLFVGRSGSKIIVIINHKKEGNISSVEYYDITTITKMTEKLGLRYGKLFRIRTATEEKIEKLGFKDYTIEEWL